MSAKDPANWWWEQPSMFDAEGKPQAPPAPPPVARATDPATSWAAAASIQGADTVRGHVLEVLRISPVPLTDEAILALVMARLGQVSPSGVRTRRRELVDAGAVRDSGELGKTKAGRAAIKWEAVPHGG